MLIGCVRAHWADQPLTVSQLAQSMKSGSNRTREERIKRAVDDGYLFKERDEQDGRASYVRPTPELEQMVAPTLARQQTQAARERELHELVRAAGRKHLLGEADVVVSEQE